MAIQYCKNKFTSTYDPTIETIYRKQVSIESKSLWAVIIDTAGVEEYSTIYNLKVQQAEGFIIVYSITDRKSFEVSCDYFQKIIKSLGDDNVPFLLVGNKLDLESEREVSTNEGEQLARYWNCPFYEISSKDKKSVDKIFSEMIDSILKSRPSKDLKIDETKFEKKESVKNKENNECKCIIL